MVQILKLNVFVSDEIGNKYVTVMTLLYYLRHQNI